MKPKAHNAAKMGKNKQRPEGVGLYSTGSFWTFKAMCIKGKYGLSEIAGEVPQKSTGQMSISTAKINLSSLLFLYFPH